MAPKILFVSGGRRNGNTFAAVQAAAQGARDVGASVSVIECCKLSGIGVGCITCGACHRNGDFKCVLGDDTAAAVSTLPHYDKVVLATPVYFFSYSTMLKGFIDRFYSLVRMEGDSCISLLTGKDFALMATSEGGEADSGVTAVRSSFRQMLDYLGANFAGECHLTDCATDPGVLRNDADKLLQAKNFGKKLGGVQ